MKYLLLPILALFTFIHAIAQDKKAEKKLLLTEELYRTGNTEAAAAEGEKVLKEYTPGKGAFFYFRILNITAKSYYHDFRFKQFEEKLNEAEKKAEQLQGSEKVLALLAVADLSDFSGQPLRAKEAADKARKCNVTGYLSAQVEFADAASLLKLGFLNNAIRLVNDLEAKQKISLEKGDTTGRYFTSESNNLIRKTSDYISVLLLKSEVLMQQGRFSMSEQVADQAVSFIKERTGSYKNELAACYRQKGRINYLSGDHAKASENYSRALSCLTVSDKVPGKAEIIKVKLFAEIELGRAVEAEELLRKLQMCGNQTAGKDVWEIYYQQALIHRSGYEGNSDKASERLNILLKECKVLPEYAPVNMELASVESELLKGKLAIDDYFRSLDKQEALKEKYYGKSSVAFHLFRLNKAADLLELRGITSEVNEIMSGSLRPAIAEVSPSEAEKFNLIAGEYFLQMDLQDSARKYLSAITLPGEAADLRTINNNVKKAYILYQSGNIAEANKIISAVEQISAQRKTEPDFETLLLLDEIFELTGQVARSQALRGQFQKLSRKKHFYRDLFGELETFYTLAGIYAESGNYYKAAGYIDDAYRQATAKLPGTPFLLKIILRNCELEIVNGNYTRADKLSEDALKLAEKLYGKSSVYYNEAKLIQASYFFAIADFQQAAEVCKSISQQNKKGNAVYNTYSLRSILLQAECLRNIRTQAKNAESTYRQGLQNVAESYGDTSELYIASSLKFASFLIESGKLDEAKKLADKIDLYWKNTSKKNRPVQYLNSQLLHAEIAYEQKKYDKAVSIYKEVLEQSAKIFSETHPEYIKAKADLAHTYFMLKEYEKSYNLMQEVLNQYDLYVSQLFPVMSFGQKSSLWNSFKDEYEFYNYLVLNHIAAIRPELSGNVYNNVISTKAILLSSDVKLRDRINTSGDSVLISLYNQWVVQKELLTAAFSLTKDEMNFDQIDIRSVEAEIARLEKEMSMRSEMFATEDSRDKIVWQDIKKTLSPGECAVELVRVRTFNHRISDSAFYAALVLSEKNTTGPDVVILKNAKDMEGKFYKFFRNATVLKLQDDISYNNFWEPIAAKLPEKGHIYFSPDGIYNQINPETFRMKDGKSLVDVNTISFVSNTKDLLNTTPVMKKQKQENENSQKVFLGGNPDFYSADKSGNIAQLPGADEEIKDISAELKKTNIAPYVLTGAALTEDTLKSLKNVNVLHLATHGYFMETKYDETRNFISNPLLNSGILLANAGDVIEGINPESKDGILTAFEAVNLNLDKTELVVLSACETGRGEVRNGEGVFGLQRSFIIAGADAVIISLFKVNDEVTRKFMRTFYLELLKSGNKRTAFNAAKIKVKQEHPEPVYWGAFVMIEKAPKAQGSVFAK
jgi:CHAT domain-containing protein